MLPKATITQDTPKSLIQTQGNTAPPQKTGSLAADVLSHGLNDDISTRNLEHKNKKTHGNFQQDHLARIDEEKAIAVGRDSGEQETLRDLAMSTEQTSKDGWPNESDSQHYEKLSELADLSAERGDYYQAITLYNKNLESNPNSVATWTSLGHCYSMINESCRAFQAYQRAMSVSGGNLRDERFWYGFGLLCEKVEDYQNAELAYRAGLNFCATSPLKGEIYYHLGYILKAKTDYDEALKFLSNAVLVGKFNNPKAVEVLCTIGRCFEEKSNFQEALRMYKHALSLDESNPLTHKFIGWLFFQMEDPVQALSYLQKEKLQETDDEGELDYMTARCYAKQKNYHLAYKLYQFCLNKRPFVSFYWSSFGVLLAEMNELKAAFEAFNQALKLNTAIAENYYNLGCLLELYGQAEGALAFYEKALGVQPTFTHALARKNYILYHAGQTQPQEITFRHPPFKLSYLKPQMKEKLDKRFTNIWRTDKNANLLLNPGAMNLLHSHTSFGRTTVNSSLQAGQAFQPLQQQPSLSKPMAPMGISGSNPSNMYGYAPWMQFGQHSDPFRMPNLGVPMRGYGYQNPSFMTPTSTGNSLLSEMQPEPLSQQPTNPYSFLKQTKQEAATPSMLSDAATATSQSKNQESKLQKLEPNLATQKDTAMQFQPPSAPLKSSVTKEQNPNNVDEEKNQHLPQDKSEIPKPEKTDLLNKQTKRSSGKKSKKKLKRLKRLKRKAAAEIETPKKAHSLRLLQKKEAADRENKETVDRENKKAADRENKVPMKKKKS